MKNSHTTLRWWDLFSVIFLLLAALTAATRLVSTRWTQHLDTIQTIAVLAIILGLALGQSRFAPFTSAIFALAYGLFIIPWQLGSTLLPELSWPERFTILINRLLTILDQIINQQTVYDSLLFLLLMAIVYWILSVHAGYTLTRYGNAWNAIIPLGLTLIIIQSFDPLISRRVWYLAFYLFFGLALIARLNFLSQRKAWLKSQTALPPHVGFEFIRFSLILLAIIILFSWTFPAMANSLPAAEKVWRPVVRTWSLARDRFENTFASLRPSQGSTIGYYGKSATLGSGNLLSDTQLFSVRTPLDAPPSVRYYWRARAYDTYENGQWLSTKTRAHAYDPSETKLDMPGYEGRFAGVFDITGSTYISTLFTPPQPIWIGRKALIEYSSNPDGTVDITTFRSTPNLEPGQVYRVQASISHPTIQQLRQSGTDYPEWIVQRYLQLPSTITQRTRDLAEEITAGLPTPYDKVVAITNYLRSNIEYIDQIPQPPDDKEPVDWFLFNLKRGFCNYYSTAEIVLLRSIGIPARWAIGFAQGERFEDGTYIVRQKDAHAWPEVYFPGVGWVEFEPTASQPEIYRLAGGENGTNLNRLSPEELTERDIRKSEADREAIPEDANPGQLPVFIQRMIMWLIVLTTIIILGFIAWRVRMKINLSRFPILLETSLIKIGVRPPEPVKKWSQRAALPPLTKSYMEINHALSRLGKSPKVADTPNERASRLVHFLPSLTSPIELLIREYIKGTYSQEPVDTSIAQKAGEQIRNHSIKNYFGRLLDRLQSSRNPEHHPLFEESSDES